MADFDYIIVGGWRLPNSANGNSADSILQAERLAAHWQRVLPEAYPTNVYSSLRLGARIKTKTSKALRRDTGRLLCPAIIGATRLFPNRDLTEGNLTTVEAKVSEEVPQSTSVCTLEGLRLRSLGRARGRRCLVLGELQDTIQRGMEPPTTVNLELKYCRSRSFMVLHATSGTLSMYRLPRMARMGTIMNTLF